MLSSQKQTPPASSDTPAQICPACGGEIFRKLFSKKSRDFWLCSSCGLQKQHPLPSDAELFEYYETSYRSGMYEDFADAGNLKNMTARQRLRELRRKTNVSGKWLDVGTSTGNFVKALLDDGVDAEGIELSETAVSVAREHGLPVRAGTIDMLPGEASFDTVSAFDVIEHVIDPIGFLESVWSRLNPGGHLVMTLPNLRSLSRFLMRSRWYFYIPEEHLHYFSPVTIAMMLRRRGFEEISVDPTYKPMTFNYAQTQFIEYNPAVYKVLNAAGKTIPASLREMVIPLPIGEMMVVARKPKAAADGRPLP